MGPKKKLTGGCSCGAVQFEVALDAVVGSPQGSAPSHTMASCPVSPAAFVLVAGEDALASLEWSAGMAKRFFCKKCGIYCFGRGRHEVTGDSFVSVNVNGLVGGAPDPLAIKAWAGQDDGSSRARPSSRPMSMVA